MADVQPLSNVQIAPTKGSLTWNSEGTEGGYYHSRRLHVPSSASGLTIGRGYDMKEKTKTKIMADLKRAGVSTENATLIAGAAGKSGAQAEKFITDNKLEKFEISQQGQKVLFDISYAETEAVVMRICSKADTVATYGAVNWGKLHGAIKEMLVDLKFRGDYDPRSRKFLQKHVAANDLAAFGAEIVKRMNWLGVPQDRFQRRKTFMEKAMKAAKVAA
ncbi:hypothetical protein [Thioclava sp. FTW29]|uniref:Pesticin C-terminal domain-containing protein n=1 Tax=Thioclava litoralis TaxID=3076557 RepID=A0ABZ1E329_9RHOB|nr:hypothetical protein RPE78_14445 [Thioclava sp. FTW29]